MKLDKKTLQELQIAYDEAVKKNVTEFEFQGQILLTTYAKYLIEFLHT
jgi:hypothetical protein